ncbi:MAG TPA: hypothetical protein DEG47_25685 [Cyanobacteria bacterium UBA11148]|nr:hypothetical protein [Cyanobacteria bacterium UBA11148]
MTKSKKQHEPRKKSQPRQQTMKKQNEYLQNPDEEMESLGWISSDTQLRSKIVDRKDLEDKGDKGDKGERKYYL